MTRRRRKKDRGQRPDNSGFKPRHVRPRSENQEDYIQSIRENDVTLCIGPAGSGKTHIAAGMAVKMMKSHHVSRIIISRPVVDVGQGIGYLPGGMEDKVGPYLTPLFDELSNYCETSLLKHWADTGELEIVPLSMMRGRTFNDSFIILDEAQNAELMELRMFFTRLGRGSTMIASGDITQTDLPNGSVFGDVVYALDGLNGVGVVELLTEDIVRHGLVGPMEARLRTL